jgi:hypothetical protein
MKKPAVEIRPNDDGTIDEIVAKGCDIHIEQMSDDGWFMGVEGKDGSYWQFWLGSKNRRSAVEVRHTEMVTAEENREMARQSRRARRGRALISATGIQPKEIGLCSDATCRLTPTRYGTFLQRR